MEKPLVPGSWKDTFLYGSKAADLLALSREQRVILENLTREEAGKLIGICRQVVDCLIKNSQINITDESQNTISLTYSNTKTELQKLFGPLISKGLLQAMEDYAATMDGTTSNQMSEEIRLTVADHFEFLSDKITDWSQEKDDMVKDMERNLAKIAFWNRISTTVVFSSLALILSGQNDIQKTLGYTAAALSVPSAVITGIQKSRKSESLKDITLS